MNLNRVETSTEVVWTDSNNVLHVSRKDVVPNIPRNFSFANIGKGITENARAAVLVSPQLFTLFVGDYQLEQGTYNDMYESAWIFTCGALLHNETVIIC
jgi:hypothetical protein